MSDDAKSIFTRPPVVGPTSFNCLLFGPPGSGKTTAAVTAPGPIVYVNLEGSGAMSYARKVAAERETELLEIQVPAKEDPRPALRDAVSYVMTNDVETIVVDTYGRVRDQIAEAIGGSSPSLPQWGEVGRAMADLTITLRDLRANVVLLAHEAITEADDGVIVAPAIGGRTTAQVAAEMDVVANTRAIQDEDGVRYVGYLVERAGRWGKDRSGGLGPVRDLDLTDWLGAFTGALALDTSDVPF
jgi:hypothetical protein